MAIDRGPWNALVDDDGSNLVGSIWNKAAIKTVILDPVDTAILPATVLAWTPTDASGAGLVFTSLGCTYMKTGRRVDIWGRLTYPTTSNGAAAILAGLPFPNSGQLAGFYQTYGFPTQFHIPASVPSIYLLHPSTQVGHTNATLSGAQLIFQGSYIAPS